MNELSSLTHEWLVHRFRLGTRKEEPFLASQDVRADTMPLMLRISFVRTLSGS